MLALTVFELPVFALPVFALSGGVDLVWHEVLGIETTSGRMVITTLVLLGPLLLLARRWHLPRGAATIVYTTAALISGMLTGFENAEILLAVLMLPSAMLPSAMLPSAMPAGAMPAGAMPPSDERVPVEAR